MAKGFYPPSPTSPRSAQMRGIESRDEASAARSVATSIPGMRPRKSVPDDRDLVSAPKELQRPATAADSRRHGAADFPDESVDRDLGIRPLAALHERVVEVVLVNCVRRSRAIELRKVGVVTKERGEPGGLRLGERDLQFKTSNCTPAPTPRRALARRSVSRAYPRLSTGCRRAADPAGDLNKPAEFRAPPAGRRRRR